MLARRDGARLAADCLKEGGGVRRVVGDSTIVICGTGADGPRADRIALRSLEAAREGITSGRTALSDTQLQSALAEVDREIAELRARLR